MHPTGLSKEAQADYDKWEDPQYMSGFNAGCEATRTARKRTEDKLNQTIADLTRGIELANKVIEGMDDEIRELKQTWYIKLWNSIPKISISIIRR